MTRRTELGARLEALAEQGWWLEVDGQPVAVTLAAFLAALEPAPACGRVTHTVRWYSATITPAAGSDE